MPEEHKHPDYEQTFARVATILAGIAREREERARRNAETDARISRLAGGTDAGMGELFEATDARNAELAQETQRALQEFIAHCRRRGAETTDKLNRLRELMDRRLRERDGR
jgi:hypothetical protein